MASYFKRSLAVLFYVLVTSGAHAQICQEADNSGGSPSGDHVYIKCDQSYRDMVVTCDDNAKQGEQRNPGTRPSCPPKPMPMITTPLASYIENYTPYLFAYARDLKDKNKAYNGPFSVGTSGGPDKVFNITGNTGTPDREGKLPAPKPMANCQDQIRLPKTFRITAPPVTEDLENQAKLERLKFDNCTNQYILRTALYPFQDSRSRLINDPQDSSKFVSLETECQPLKVDESISNDNEYKVSDYIIAAWKKLLSEPDYRYTKTKLKLTMLAERARNKANLTLPTIEENKHEPHLPPKVTIDNPIKPPTSYDKVKPSHLAATSFEKISDPSHPFSPRWDFPFNERDFYSQMTGKYQKETENSVYCAGVKEAKNESDEVKKANKEVKVDVLSFRERAFTEGILMRIGYNTICKKDADDNQEKDGFWITLLLTSYCVKLHPANIVTCTLYGTNCQKTGTQRPCWKCFQLDGKVDNPPCSTRYDEKDLKIKAKGGELLVPGLYNGFQRKASCNPVYYFRKGKHNIDKLCNKLRQPYTQINRLKMRYDNPDDKDNNALTAGVQEGFRFTDYFGHHMPYPRLYDTGTSLHKSQQTDTNYQQADDTNGQFATIVGVGREGAPKSAGDDAQKKHKDERCLLGGWGGAEKTEVTVTGIRPSVEFLGSGEIKVPDPVSSWTEFKAYQMRTMRLANISCIGRYEKVFKSGSSENIPLRASGGEWSNVVVQKCPKNDEDTTKCTYMSLKEFVAAGRPTSDADHYVIPQQKLENWPLSWRGYIVKGTKGDGKGEQKTADPDQFPNFGGTIQTVIKGLGKAEPGDIVLMPRGPIDESKKPGLAKVALVTEVNLPKSENFNKSGPPYVPDCIYDKLKAKDKPDCYVQVLEADNGKYPDVCGTTDTFGEFKTRYMYRPGWLTKPATQELTDIKSTINCDDTRLLRCDQNEYERLTLYRIRKDVRKGCDKEKAKDCS